MRYQCKVYEGERVNLHYPSVEVLFESIAELNNPNVISVMLTGMGKDGASSMQKIHQMGGSTIAQDEQSSVVWGMPGAAVKLGCIDKIVPLDEIAQEIIDQCRQSSKVKQAAQV